MVGGRGVRVGADNQGHLAVEGMREGHLLAGGLGMDVHDDGLHGAAEP